MVSRVVYGVAAAAVLTAASGAPDGSRTSAPQTAIGSNPVDAAYDGQFCNFPANPDRKLCWRVTLKFQNGVAMPTWPSRVAGRFAIARVTIDPAGAARIALDGWNVTDGNPLGGTLVGRLVDDRIDAQGRWANGTPIEGRWKRTP